MLAATMGGASGQRYRTEGEEDSWPALRRSFHPHLRYQHRVLVAKAGGCLKAYQRHAAGTSGRRHHTQTAHAAARVDQAAKRSPVLQLPAARFPGLAHCLWQHRVSVLAGDDCFAPSQTVRCGTPWILGAASAGHRHVHCAAPAMTRHHGHHRPPLSPTPGGCHGRATMVGMCL